MVRSDRLIFAELKRGDGKTTDAQDEWIDALANVEIGSPRVEMWLWRPSDWPQIEEVLRRAR